ncbi:MAG: hypothetical protein QOH89_2300 [Pseudonocardiales bacterium]|jgi:hypothetical protein|nr:hypothetical protein [Pseudonocardiales bacterium]
MSGRLRNRVVGAGAAGVAAVLAVAPFAQADPVDAQSSAGPAPVADGSGQVSTKAQQPHGELQPNFGSRKIRVGVQIKDGAWVPPDTTTGHTKVTIEETGPSAEQAIFFNGGATSCRTVEGTQDVGATETFCEFNHNFNQVGADAKTAVVVPDGVSFEDDYLAGPGDTVTFTQVTVNRGLVIDSQSQTIGPCVLPPPTLAARGGGQFPTCLDAIDDVVFTDPGLPPTAVDNHATVVSGHSVLINVLKNDITHGAPDQIDSTTQPSHGKVLVGVGQAASPDAAAANSAKAKATFTVEYKSKAPYVGPDKFRYTMSTPNGKSTATVFITVIAPPPVAVDNSATTDQGTPVTIDVLDNDDARGGGALSVQSVGTPGHGTATISNGQIVYTPDADFVGTDTFPYTAATQFGTDTALVTVTIEASGLSATGSDSHNLANIGALLLLTGGVATVAGRRRYRAKHAGFH